MTKRLDIQGIRALAVVMVVAFHAGLPFPGGFSGVDVFFVVSGFVIGRLLLKEVETTGRIDLRRFFGGRVRRLVPALTVVLIATIVATGVVTVGDRTEDTIQSAFAALLMVSNAFFYLKTGGYFDVQDTEVPLLHTWTLSVEAQFYVVAPLALLAAWWVARRLTWPRRRTVFAITAALAAGSLLVGQLLADGHTIRNTFSEPQSIAFYASPTRAWEFLVGTLIAIAEARLIASRRTRAGSIAAIVGLVTVVAAAFFAGETGAVPGTGVFLPVIGAALLIAGSTVAPGGPAARLLSLRPLTRLGDVSYSWYLWHWPFIVLGGIAAAGRDLAIPLALASLVPAFLSYRFVEERVRKGSSIRGWRVPAFVAACAIVLAASSVGVRAGQSELVARAGISNLTRAIEQRAIVENDDCRSDAGDAWVPGTSGVAHCTPEIAASAPRILLVGDSQADAYGYGMRRVARARGMRLDIVTGPSCLAAPLLDADGERVKAGTVCDGEPEQIQASIATEPPALLVVAQAASNEALDPSKNGGSGTEAEGLALQRRYETALRTLTAPVLEGGGDVLFVRTVPRGARDGSVCGTMFKVLAGKVRSCLSEDRGPAEIAARRLPIWQGTLTVTAAGSRMHRFDPASLFCDASTCSQIRGGLLAYRNSDHLSVDGSLGITEHLGAAVDEAMRAGT